MIALNFLNTNSVSDLIIIKSLHIESYYFCHMNLAALTVAVGPNVDLHL